MKVVRSITLVTVPVITLCACSLHPRLPTASDLPFVHKVDIQQGNVITQEMLSQLEPGMDKVKVRFIMGSPLIVDTFHNDRWDYVYSLQEGGGPREQRRVSLFFENEKLVRAQGDIKSALGRLEVQRERSTMVAVPGEYEPSLLDKLKHKVTFGEDEDEDAAAAAAGAGKDGAKSGAAGSGDDAGAATAATGTDGATANGEGTGDGAGTETATAGEDAPATSEDKVATQTVIVPEDAPRRKKGFFRRLMDKLGKGEKSRSDSAGGSGGYRDPTERDEPF